MRKIREVLGLKHEVGLSNRARPGLSGFQQYSGRVYETGKARWFGVAAARRAGRRSVKE
jgi:hypothetical protein